MYKKINEYRWQIMQSYKGQTTVSFIPTLPKTHYEGTFNLAGFWSFFKFGWRFVLHSIAWYEVVCSAVPSSSAPRGDFWHTECSLLDCINDISSRIVIEIPVSSAWCVNVIQIPFYSREKRLTRECSLCIKHFGSNIWLFLFCCCPWTCWKWTL